MMQNTGMQPTTASSVSQIDLSLTIQNEEQRLNGIEKRHRTFIKDTLHLVVKGYIQELEEVQEKETGLRHEVIIAEYPFPDGYGVHHPPILDKEMWDEIQLRIWGANGLSSMIQIYVGVLGSASNISVLRQIFPQLEQIVTIQGGKREVTRDITQFRQAPQGTEEKSGKGNAQETEPMQIIQTQGQPLPNTDALNLGNRDERVSHLIRFFEWASIYWEAYYEQARRFPSRQEALLKRIASDIRPELIEAQAICGSAFEVVKAEWRKLAASLYRAQMTQSMWIPPQERQRREGGWGIAIPGTKDADAYADAGNNRQLAEARRLAQATSEEEDRE